MDLGTGRAYGWNVPGVTMRDMVDLQARLLEYLGVEKMLSVTGASMGGMTALQWMVSYPQRVRSAIPIATTHRHSAQQIAFNELSRQSIMVDPQWNNGDYYGQEGLRLGLAVAGMTGHVTYLCVPGMGRKFGRRRGGREGEGVGGVGWRWAGRGWGGKRARGGGGGAAGSGWRGGAWMRGGVGR